MKAKLLLVALYVITVVTVIAYPIYFSTPAQARVTPPLDMQPPPSAANSSSIDVVFVLDTTGSMSGLIQTAKQKIWSIATTLASAQQAPQIRMGLVAYRDRGDAYITRVVDLSSDLDSVYATLMDFQADGGGDHPESVNQALYDAVHNISWSQAHNAYKVIFLVGDAPPHSDYHNEIRYPASLVAAKRKGIVVNAIQCGQDQATMQHWQHIARLGKGNYFQVEQAGGAVAISTPYDRDMAALSKQLDDTRIYYGDAEQRRKLQDKRKATDKLHEAASAESRARRAEFNLSKSGKLNQLGENELIEGVLSGRVDPATLPAEQLPEPMRGMNKSEQKVFIARQAARRQQLEAQIKVLADKRKAHIQQQLESRGDVADSLDNKLFSTVREQAAEKGLDYEAAAPAY